MKLGRPAAAALAVVAALAALSGCAADQDSGAKPGNAASSSDGLPPTSAAHPVPSPPGSTPGKHGKPGKPVKPGPGEEPELTAEEAERLGVLYATYDAKLTGDRTLVEGSAQLTLTNLGKREDLYRIRLDPGMGAVSPSMILLEPGEKATIEIRTHLSQIAVRVASEGRGGVDLADAELTTAANNPR